jgi:hypothetical protein
MRTIPLICALLLLTSCHQPQVGPLQVGPLADDSPIIISGGSTLIGNPNFTLRGDQDAEITTVTHTARALGFLCDPASATSLTSCATAPPCPQGANTTRCRVDNLDAHNNWDLALCDLTTPCSANGDLRVQWISGGAHLKVHIHKVASGPADAFQYPSTDLLVHPVAPSLHDAKLALHGGGNPTYDFSNCTKGQTCLAILF